MRNFFLVFLLSLPTLSYAISCPNNGTVLDTGYSIYRVLGLCGNYESRKDYTVQTNATELWTYFKPAPNNGITQVLITFTNGSVVNIHIQPFQSQNFTSGQNVLSSYVCGNLIQNGFTKASVIANCGSPANTSVLQQASSNITELTYPGAGPRTLVFENNLLTDWKEPTNA